ncbi:zinc ribbon domain-containing protein [Gangjinia marincola]|uniref:zinc ribbon domain-containing protein n=1 Tax=Gangjinia marincola TaxID=578463 RepID=UPI0031D3780D
MKPLQYTCPKCRHHQYTIGEMRATGGRFSKLFNIQTEKFSSVTCKQCKYTEFYKAPSSALGNFFDFFTN